MNPERWKRVREVFDQAIVVPEGDRAAFLDSVCSGDIELRQEVESLLRSHQEAGSIFLEKPAADLKAALADAAEHGSRAGRRVGVYRLIEQIGEGGMGEVYRAERADGMYDKQVAIKFVRVGFDTKAVLRTLPPRATGVGFARSSQHRALARRRHHRRRHSLPGNGADRRHSFRSILRDPQA